MVGLGPAEVKIFSILHLHLGISPMAQQFALFLSSAAIGRLHRGPLRAEAVSAGWVHPRTRSAARNPERTSKTAEGTVKDCLVVARGTHSGQPT